MSVATELQYASIADIASLIHKREVSPVELAQAQLDRIAALDPRVNSYLTVTGDLALAQARESEAELASGKDRGALHGVPIALKDLYATQGVRTTAHSKVLETWVPDTDATTTRLLREAGTVLLGKLAMHEFAYGGPTTDTPFPPARNPWDLAHVTGGSSSGSGAALAAGLCYGALGSDTGGSIRTPAALCGVVGLKPTYGRVSRSGVVPLSWSLDHAGPMARTVEDCALLLQAIAGHDPKDAACSDMPVLNYTAGLAMGVAGLRVGVPRSWLSEREGTDGDVLAAFEAALKQLERLGARIVDIDGQPFIDARQVNTLILTAEAYTYHEPTLRTHAEDIGFMLRNRLREGAFLTAADYANAMRARTVLCERINAMLRDVDLIASPAAPQPAETFEDFDAESRFRYPSYTAAFNLTGLPAISVPCGFTSAGLPIGLQMASRAFEEATVLRAANAYERSQDWVTRHPEL
jgi:aspartyl-tRNA(Asn)/glutamyl-tRNA(Gln) amidotransferase subunit A